MILKKYFVLCFVFYRQDIMVGPQYQAIIPPLGSYTCYEKGAFSFVVYLGCPFLHHMMFHTI